MNVDNKSFDDRLKKSKKLKGVVLILLLAVFTTSVSFIMKSLHALSDIINYSLPMNFGGILIVSLIVFVAGIAAYGLFVLKNKDLYWFGCIELGLALGVIADTSLRANNGDILQWSISFIVTLLTAVSGFDNINAKYPFYKK